MSDPKSTPLLSVLPLSVQRIEVMKRLLLYLILLSATAFEGFSQCQVYDGQGTASGNPVWVSCSGGTYTLYIQSPNNFGALTIDWGDGSGVTNVASLISPAFVSHTYAAAVANYTVTITEPGTGCVITGLVVLEEPVNASIQIPIGGVTQTCAPDVLIFTNSSTDVSSNTTFEWDFGDGSPVLTFGDTNAGQTISHQYDQGTVNCVTQVTLTAENYCSFGNPTVASFNPIQIYDIDDAQITADNQLLCYPDTVVHFDNTTNKNCLAQGNTAQRFEYWNFGNYWGTGTDSIIDWTPFDPPAKPGYDIAFPGIGTYTIMMADSNMCGADTTFITVQITNPPTAGISSSTDSSCAGDPVVFTNLGANGTQYRIDFGDGGGFGAFGATATHTYNTAGTYTVIAVANIAGGSAACTDTAMTVVEILPSPNAMANITPSGGCDSVLATFTNNSTGGSLYFWNFGGGDTSSLQNPPPLSYTTAGQHVITLTVTSNNGCIDSTTTTVDVYDTPVAAFTALNVCEDALATFSDASTVGYGGPVNSWDWSFGDAGNSTSTQQNPTFTYVDSGTFVIELIAATSFCSDTTYDTITVEPRPTAIFQESDSIGCSPLNVTFTNQSVFGTTYQWFFGDGSTSTQTDPTYTFTHSSMTDTAFVVKLVAYSAFGCADSVTYSIVVRGNPQANFTSDAVLDCAPLEVQFADSSVGGSSLAWDFGDGSGSTLPNPSHTFQNQTQFITNYTVTLVVTAANGCTDTATQTVTVYPEPLFNFSIVPDSGCSPLTVQFPVAVGAVLYSWDFGDGGTSTGANPSHTFVNSTTNNANYTVQLVATSPFGCIDTVTGTVVVFPKPNAGITPAISQGCEPLAVTFTNTSTGGTTYNWDFDDGNTLTSGNATVSHSFVNSTNDTLFFYPSLIATTPDGCADTASVEVRAYRRVEALFATPAPGCHPLDVTFVDQSTNPNSWAWIFGDGNTSTQQNPSHQYTNNGTAPVNYTAQLTVQSVEGCQDSYSTTVTVNHRPNADILPVSAEGCQPLTVNFANNSTAGTTYFWDMGDGTTSTTSGNLSHTFSNSTNDTLFFTPILEVTTAQGCTDSTEASVAVYRKVEASFSVPDLGCHPFTTVFTDLSTNAVNWDWDFDDGLGGFTPNPSHTFNNTGSGPQVFNVTLTVQNVEGCADDTVVPVTVNPSPTSIFVVDASPACNGVPVNIANNSLQNETNTWRFSASGFPFVYNGLEIDTIFNNFSSTPNEFVIELVVENSYGCTDTSDEQMTVYPRVTSEFISLEAGCSPFEVDFTNLSSGGTLYEWDFGDGGTSFLEEPSHTFENNTSADSVFNVTLRVTSPYGCVDTDTFAITVYPTPEAIFTLNPVVQVYPDSVVQFDNLTADGPWDFEWDFGNGGTSMAEEPNFHVYNTWGTYTVVLRAYSAHCDDTTSRTVTIEPPLPVADFEIDLEACAPVTVQFENLSEYGEFFVWEFGDGATSSSEDPLHTYQFPGTYTVRLTVTGPGGDVDVKELVSAISVYTQPTANFVFTPTEVAASTGVVSFVNYSQFADEYLWDFGDSTTSVEANPQKLYQSGGQFFPSLVASTSFGCSDTFVSALPVIATERGNLQVPNAFTPSTTGSSGGAYDPLAYDNQVFFPVLTGVTSDNYTLSIFNRWGELIFETHDIDIGWDGYYRGKPCQQDVYVWKVKGEYVNGQKFSQVGDVTLIK